MTFYKKIAFGDDLLRFSVVRKMFYTFLHHKKILGIIFGVLFLSNISFSWAQQFSNPPQITIQIIDKETNTETPARIYLTNNKGQPLWPKDANIRYDWHGAVYFYTPGKFTLETKNLPINIRIAKGPEYETIEKTIQIEDLTNNTISFYLKRWIDMNKKSWYSGDNHMHMHYGGVYQNTPKDLMLMMEAEDLNIANPLVANSADSLIFDEAHFSGKPHQLSTTKRILYFNEEFRANIYGHLVLLRLKELVRPLYTGFRNTPHSHHYPLNLDIARQAHKQGGLVSYPHPMFRKDPFEAGPTAIEMPIDCVFGEVDAIDVMAYGANEMYTLDLWYRLLNCGFRLSASAGTDAFLNMKKSGQFSNPMAGDRVYCYLSGELNYDGWIEALKKGRSFVTNGPMIDWDVEGYKSGDTIVHDKPRKVRISIKVNPVRKFEQGIISPSRPTYNSTPSLHTGLSNGVNSNSPIDLVEIVYNGKIVASKEISSEEKDFAFDYEIELDKSGWLAARCFAKVNPDTMDTPQMAHTSPIYVNIGNKAVGSSEDARYFLEWIQRLRNLLNKYGRFQDSADHNSVMSVLSKAEEFYANMARTHTAYNAVEIFENAQLRVEFDRSDGKILQIYNKISGDNLLNEKRAKSTVPWRLFLTAPRQKNETITTNITAFSLNRRSPNEAVLIWHTQENIRVRVDVRLDTTRPLLFMTPSIQNYGNYRVESFSFPVLDGIQTLGSSNQDDYLAIPLAMGFLIHKPLEAGRFDNFRSFRYPDGYAGFSMQFIGYYNNKGGFYLASYDPYSTVKDFNMEVKNKNMYLTVRHYHWDAIFGNNMNLDFPIVIGAFGEGGWFETAEFYRDWIENGPNRPKWVSKGPRWKQDDANCAHWLFKDVGFSTFGISSQRDQSVWYKAIHEIAGVPVLHVTSFDWWPWPNNKYSDWAVVGIHPNNLKVIKENGDFLSPFKFDQRMGAENIEASLANDSISAEKKHSGVLRMCPLRENWQKFYLWRDKEIISSPKVQADALYNDISASNGPLSCWNITHQEHPQRGFGRWLVEAHRELFHQSHEATKTANNGKYVPIGTEVIIENFVSEIDFYQARSAGGPQNDMEGEFLLELQKKNEVETIPLFNYVYHEYGPIGMDGDLKLSKEYGDIFYWIVSKVILEGNLPELNYEFSSLELFPNITGSAFHISYTGKQFVENKQPYQSDPKKTEFLSHMAKARTGWSSSYLAYGRMEKPLVFLKEVDKINLSWHHYNDIANQRIEKGIFSSPSIVHTAFRNSKGRLGFFFVNLKESEQTINVKFDPKQYGLLGSPFKIRCLDGNGVPQDNLIQVSKENWLLFLPVRHIIIVEVIPE